MLNIKSYLVGIFFIFLMGCSTPHKKSLFGKESNTLEKSACEHCKKAPFYVDGRWM